jgi:hypothetical protein
MYIVARVLREFRSPITAILAAGENIRDGLLEDKEKPARIRNHHHRTGHAADESLGTNPALRRNIRRSRRDMRALTVGEVIGNTGEHLILFSRTDSP